MAYTLTAENRSTGTPAAAGSAVLFSRGDTTAQLVVIRAGNQALPKAFLPNLAATLSKRIGAPSP